ncbi:hypothetical protein [Paenibacillus xylanexedens]|uniref:hypothetical protein n=1 Tax=Paenibacillus xylanexedens TaxID=528191 RepID=UPI001C930150|nr:hypothetical protein [Paenibacillus xylanexedens]
MRIKSLHGHKQMNKAKTVTGNATSIEVGKIDLKPKHLLENNRYTKVTTNGTKVPVVTW